LTEIESLVQLNAGTQQDSSAMSAGAFDAALQHITKRIFRCFGSAYMKS